MLKKATHFRWIILTLVFFITVLNYMDRASISYAVDIFTRESQLNDTQVGLILGAFSIGYVVTTFLGGIVVDRWGARRTLFLAAILWSFALMLGGLAVGFLTLFLSRILLGLAEGPNFPALTRVVSDWLSIRERTRALSYALIAVPIGLAVGAPVISNLIIYLTWRGMFFILGLLTAIWLPFWWVLFRDMPNESKHVNSLELKHIGAHAHHHSFDKNGQYKKQFAGLWRFLFSNKTLLVNYWAFFIFGYYLFFFMGWLPIYLSKAYHLDLHQVGLFSILPWVFGALMMWGGGILSDHLYLKTQDFRTSRSYIIWVSQLCAALCLFPIIVTHTLFVAILFISLAVGFILSANGAYYAVNIDIAKARSGTAMGIMDAFFALAGFISPVLTGWITTRTGTFYAAFSLMILLALSSVILIILFHRPKEEARFS